MKKIILLVATIFALDQANAICFQDKADDIRFDDMVKEDLDNLRSRSIGPIVEGRVDYDMGQIEIAINTYIETEWGAYLPIPACAGAYTLKIDSPVAEFTGSFIVD